MWKAALELGCLSFIFSLNSLFFEGKGFGAIESYICQRVVGDGASVVGEDELPLLVVVDATSGNTVSIGKLCEVDRIIPQTCYIVIRDIKALQR